jgi:hypothetical protein
MAEDQVINHMPIRHEPACFSAPLVSPPRLFLRPAGFFAPLVSSPRLCGRLRHAFIAFLT